MKILSVKFERPYRRERDPEVEWEFVIETDEVCHSQNCQGFGGKLRKHPDGWQAKAYSAEQYSAPAKSREEAIQNCIPDALALFAKHGEEQKQEEQHREDRYKVRQVLAELLTAHRTGLDISVGVNAHELNEPIKFTIKIDSLTEAQVRDIADVLETA